MKKTILALLIGAPLALVHSAEVESVRDSQYEWECQRGDTTLVSGHTRQDKAFQSCYNEALATGDTYYVVGGRFRVTASGTDAPPEPPPTAPPCEWDSSIPADDPACVEPPPPPPPEEQPQVTFGPVSDLTEYPSNIGALKQNTFRWEVTFTLNTLPTSGRMGLASRDQSGTLQVGHFSLYVEPNGVLILRHQDACANCGGSGEEFKLIATTSIVAGQEYTVVASMSSSQGTALWVDGVMEAHDPRSWGLDSNNLPLIVGGLCTVCDPKAVPPVGPRYPIDGTVYMEVYDKALPPAGEQPYFQLTWNEGDGTVPLPWEFMPHFGQTAGRVEIDFTPAMLHTTGASQAIFDVPDHLGVWVWNDGIHGEWYNDAGERRLWRARWGLIEAGREVKIVVTWNAAGYAVLIDDVLRIHDWQTTPTTVYPDPQAVAGVYGSRANSTRPATGTFALRVYDKSASYDPCAVDVVGTINENVPLDNSGAWSQGKAPECATASVELRWVNPTEYVNGDLIGPGELTEIRLYQDGQKIAGVNPDVAVYEAIGLHAGREYCFEATAVAAEESDPSNQVCRTP